MIHGHIVTPHAYLDFQLLSVTDNHVVKLSAILPCHRTEGNKEIDDSCQEILGRVREELVTSTAACLSCALIQCSKQSGSSFRGSTQIWDILSLDWVHSIRVLYIGKVDDVKSHILRDISQHFVLVEVVECHFGQSWKLVVIHNE